MADEHTFTVHLIDCKCPLCDYENTQHLRCECGRAKPCRHCTPDDIVTRLRDGDRCESFCDVCTSPHLLAREAADEIERLRGMLYRKVSHPHACSTGFAPCWCEEADRA